MSNVERARVESVPAMVRSDRQTLALLRDPAELEVALRRAQAIVDLARRYDDERALTLAERLQYDVQELLDKARA